MPHISKTVRAESDRYEHWFYIAQDNISAADALLDGIEQRLRLLANQPGMGRPRPELAPEFHTAKIRVICSASAAIDSALAHNKANGG